jgi:hypothetical protein
LVRKSEEQPYYRNSGGVQTPDHASSAPDRDRGRPTKSRAARNVGDRDDLDAWIDSLHSQAFPQDRVLDLVEAINQLGAGILLRDGAGQHGAATLAVECGNVGTAAGEAHARGRVRSWTVRRRREDQVRVIL